MHTMPQRRSRAEAGGVGGLLVDEHAPFGNSPLPVNHVQGFSFNDYELADYLNFGFSTKYHDSGIDLVVYQLRSYSRLRKQRMKKTKDQAERCLAKDALHQIAPLAGVTETESQGIT
jgi:hypothetical protein